MTRYKSPYLPNQEITWSGLIEDLEHRTARKFGIVSLSAFAIGFMAFGSILTTAAQSIWF